MSIILGKRKRDGLVKRSAGPLSSSSSSDEDQDLHEAFRRAFEKRFKPLNGSEKATKTQEEPQAEVEDEGESDWQGLDSEDEQEENLQVIEYGSAQAPERVSKAELRAFMQYKPPASETSPGSSKPSTKAKPEDDAVEKINLKNDMALQRLISESHLLDTSKQTQPSIYRQKVLDMRLQSLGSKASFLKQEKMPLSHRKGIAAKGLEREERRRREAKENGVILEKAQRSTKKTEKRVRGVGGPSVGKFKGGMLSLSKKDVADIRGPKRRGGFKKGSKR